MSLRIESVDLSYGASRCLRGVSLEAEPGRITCVLGRNGVGKSSLMRAIVGLERVERGRILWEGRDIAALPPAERARAGIGYVPQGREIFPFLTVGENIETALAPAPRGERFVSDEIFALFPILKQLLRRRGGDLSGGQQQQLALARAHTARGIRHLARERNMAVVLVEQYFEFARDLADRIAVMVRGEVALGGPVDS